MNKIKLRGIIKNIEYSHNIKDIEFYKANLIVKRENNKEDLIPLKFKRFSNKHEENSEITLEGNIRTYSSINNNKTKVELFVFTYFDEPEKIEENNNYVELCGNICKKGTLRKTKSGKDVIDIILANNITTNKKHTLNCYIPVVAWGKDAKRLNKLEIGNRIKVIGTLRSREYRKMISDNDFEIRIAHEVVISSFDVVSVDSLIDIDDIE